MNNELNLVFIQNINAQEYSIKAVSYEQLNTALIGFI